MLHRRSISVQSHCSISELNLLDCPIFHDHPIDILDTKSRYHFSIINLWHSTIKDLMGKYPGFFREISIGIAREKNMRDYGPLSFRVLLVDFENFKKILHVRAILRFCWLVLSCIFSFPHLSYKNWITDKGILVCRPNRLHVPKNVIKTHCCKMQRSCVFNN